MSVAAQKREVIESTRVREEPPGVPEIMQRYLDGTSIQVLAKECGIKSRRTLYKWMFAEVGEERYRELVTECLINRMADADDGLDAALLTGDAATVSAAREICRFARMDFERRRPALYGAKPEGAGGGVTFVMQVANLRGGELEVRAPLAMLEEQPPPE